MALTRACPSTKERWTGLPPGRSTTGASGFDGLYADLHEVGGLSAYASRVEDLVDQQRARYRAWFSAMDRPGWSAGSSRRRGNLHRASWNPVRLSHHGTVEIRSMDANFPEMVLAVCPHPRRCGERIRHERLEVRPSRECSRSSPMETCFTCRFSPT